MFKNSRRIKVAKTIKQDSDGWPMVHCLLLLLLLLLLPLPPPGMPQQQYDDAMEELEQKLSDYRNIIEQQEQMLQHAVDNGEEGMLNHDNGLLVSS